MDKIVVYGAGSDFRCILDGGAGKVKENIAFIVDGDEQKIGTSIDGILIKDRKVLAELAPETVLVISSKRYYDEIERLALECNKDLQCILLEDYVSEHLPAIGVCNICHHKVRYWSYAGNDVDTAYPIIGNGQRSGRCPYCGEIDRTRWVKQVCKKETGIYSKGGRILHFAPEGLLAESFIYAKNVELYTADIAEGRADYVVDITDIQFEESYFDYCIANHVLEHIVDEEKAIRELQRVTKSGGKIVLSFPVCMEIETLEDEKYNSDELREKYYGQNDHVRLYGKDFKRRLEEYGLIVNVFSPQDSMSREESDYYGFLYEDKVLVCENRK